MKFISVVVASLAAANAFTAVVPVTRPAFKAFTTLNMVSQDELKKQVGYKAVDDYVTSGMVIGLGTGSTAYYAVERVGQKLKSGELKDILAIPTSIRTKEQAESLGIPLVTLDTHSKLDVAIDGADEVDPDLNLVKGGGGALLREKMVEIMADKFICIGMNLHIFIFSLLHFDS
jgi:ribose 5-phosphate isomerase A